jgi:uncharacterized membrane protein YbhN (UPF0104 family)
MKGRLMINFSGKKSLPLLALKIVAAALFLFFLRHDKNLSLGHFQWVWGHASPACLLISFILSAAVLWLNILRWHHFMKCGGFATTVSQSASSYLAGALLGLVSPGRMAEFGRGYLYPDYPVSDTALVTLAEKFYFVFFTLVFGAAGLFFGARPLIRAFSGMPYAVAAVLLICALAVSAWVILKGRRIAFKGLLRFFPVSEPGRLYLLTLTAIAYILMIFQFHLILAAFFDVKLLHAFITLSVTLVVITFFPVSFGNLGVREACFIVLLKALGDFPEVGALNAGFLVFLENIFLPSILGLVVVLCSRNSRKMVFPSG